MNKSTKINSLSELQKLSKFTANQHGWHVEWSSKYRIHYPDTKYLSIGDALALCHSELSEALDAYRDNDKKHFATELADAIIRILHIAGDLDMDLTEAINEKMKINQSRPILHGRVNY